MEATSERAIRVSGSRARRPIAFAIAALVVAVLATAIVVWGVSGTERSPGGAPTPAAVSEIRVDPPNAGAHRSTALLTPGEAEFPSAGPHPPGRQPKDG
jgi:hypothetical protein